MLIILLLVTLLLLMMNAFFVLAEFSSVKVRSTRVEELVDKGDGRAKVLQHIQQHLDEYLSVCQVGITLASIGLGFVGKPAFEILLSTPLRWLGITSHRASDIATVVVAYMAISFLHVSLGELMPKLMVIRRPEACGLWMAVPFQVFYFVFYVPLWLLNSSASLLLRLFGMSAPAKDPAHSENEMRIIMERSQSSGLISFRRLLLMENIFDMGSLKVRDAMKSPKAVKCLNRVAPWAENLALIRDSKYSRFPVVAEGQELPLGIVHVKDVLHLELNKQESPDLTPALRSYLKVADDMPLESLMTELQRHRRRVAIVTDRKGQWVGFITLEDIVEEIIGSIEDEFEKEAPLFLADTMSEGRVVLGVRATDIFGAISQILARVDVAELPLAREKIERAVLDREKDISTYLGHGVAVPHARFEGLDRPVLVFAQSAEGVPVAGAGERIHIFFILLTPLSAPQFQVRLLARICGVMQSDYVVEQLRQSRDAHTLLELVRAADPGTIG